MKRTRLAGVKGQVKAKRLKTDSPLVHIINGKQYLKMEYMHKGGIFNRQAAEEAAILSLGAIQLGVDETKEINVLRDGYIIVEYLVPVGRVEEFSRL